MRNRFCVGVDIKVIVRGLPCPACCRFCMFNSWQRNSPCCLVEVMCNPEIDQSSKILIVPLSSHSLHTGAVWSDGSEINWDYKQKSPTWNSGQINQVLSWCSWPAGCPDHIDADVNAYPRSLVCISDLTRHDLIIWSVTLSHCPIVRLPTGQFRLNTPAHSLGLEWSPDGPDSAVNPHYVTTLGAPHS